MLELKNVSKSFKINEETSLEVLKDVSFNIKENGLYFIVGKSGSGKSTLLNILQTILTPDSGEVIFDGKNIFNLKEKERVELLKKDIGTIFQFYNLIDYISVKENIYLSKEIKEVEDKEYIDNLIEKYGISSLLNKKVNELSGGEKQRAAIIRSIVSKPKLLLCDEPTGALDHTNANIIMDTLKELSTKSIVIVVTHNNELVEQYGDALYELVDGSINLAFNKIKEAGKVENIALPKEKKKTKKRKKYRGFATFLALKHLKNDLKINLISSFSIILTLLVFFFSLGFYNGYGEAQNSILDTFLNKDVFLISKTYLQNSSNEYIQITRKERPEDEEVYSYLEDIDDFGIYDNLDYFFKTPYEMYSKNNLIEGVRFLPYFPTGSSNLFYVNSLFDEQYGNDNNEYEVSFYRRYDYLDNTSHEFVEEEFSLDLSITVNGVIDEFTYLNEPTVYYPYYYFLNILSSMRVTNINNKLSTYYSWLDILTLSSKDDEICSYNKIIHIEDSKYISTIREKIANYDIDVDELKIENDTYTIVSSFTTLSESLFIGIELFLIITVLCSIFLVGFISFSSFMKKRKEVAILRVLGAKENNVLSVFIIKEILLFCISFVIAIILYFIGAAIANVYLYEIFAYSGIINLDILSFIIIFLLGIVVCTVSSFLPLKVSKKIDVASELKEE